MIVDTRDIFDRKSKLGRNMVPTSGSHYWQHCKDLELQPQPVCRPSAANPFLQGSGRIGLNPDFNLLTILQIKRNAVFKTQERWYCIKKKVRHGQKFRFMVPCHLWCLLCELTHEEKLWKKPRVTLRDGSLKRGLPQIHMSMTFRSGRIRLAEYEKN